MKSTVTEIYVHAEWQEYSIEKIVLSCSCVQIVRRRKEFEKLVHGVNIGNMELGVYNVISVIDQKKILRYDI